MFKRYYMALSQATFSPVNYFKQATLSELLEWLEILYENNEKNKKFMKNRG